MLGNRTEWKGNPGKSHPLGGCSYTLGLGGEAPDLLGEEGPLSPSLALPAS